MRDPGLWKRISDCHPDDLGGELTFTRKLAREQGWSPEFAGRVVREYQRFAYLSQLGAGAMSPSVEVDQAWHLHMTYTRHYWGPFTKAMGGALHHMPGTGAAGEASAYRQIYEKTLDLYRTQFGEPPADIWPSAEERYARKARYRRLNTNDVWIIPKPSWPAGRVTNTLPQVPRHIRLAALTLAAIGIGTGVALAQAGPQGGGFLDSAWGWVRSHPDTLLFGLGALGFAIWAIFFVFLKEGDKSHRKETEREECVADTGCESLCSGND